MGTWVSVWDNEKVQETDNDGYTTLWLYLMPLNCSLEMIIILNSKLHDTGNLIKNQMVS